MAVILRSLLKEALVVTENPPVIFLWLLYLFLNCSQGFCSLMKNTASFYVRQAGRQDGQAGRQVCRRTDGRTGGQADTQDEQVGRQTGRTDGKTDRQREQQSSHHRCVFVSALSCVSPCAAAVCCLLFCPQYG